MTWLVGSDATCIKNNAEELESSFQAINLTSEGENPNRDEVINNDGFKTGVVKGGEQTFFHLATFDNDCRFNNKGF